MAKKKTGSGKKTLPANGLRSFDVYQQSDSSLVVLPSADTPEDDSADLVATVDAVDKMDAIRQVKKSHKWTKHLAVADPSYDPDISMAAHDEAERLTNERLGIKQRPAKGRTKSAATSRAKKAPAKRAVKKSSRRK